MQRVSTFGLLKKQCLQSSNYIFYAKTIRFFCFAFAVVCNRCIALLSEDQNDRENTSEPNQMLIQLIQSANVLNHVSYNIRYFAWRWPLKIFQRQISCDCTTNDSTFVYGIAWLNRQNCQLFLFSLRKSVLYSNSLCSHLWVKSV